MVRKHLAMGNTTGAKSSTRKKPIQNELLPSTKVISHGDKDLLETEMRNTNSTWIPSNYAHSARLCRPFGPFSL